MHFRVYKSAGDGADRPASTLAAVARAFRLDPQFVASRQDQEAALGPSVFDREHPKRVDQFLEDDRAWRR
jgi:hypothetical protein